MIRSTSRILSRDGGRVPRAGCSTDLRRVWFSSSSDQQRRRENSARLRALRQSQSSPAAAETSSSENGVNYRYRKGSTESVSDLWGKEARTAEADRQRTSSSSQGKKFVPFFQEVDAIVEKRKKVRKNKSSLKPAFDSLGNRAREDLIKKKTAAPPDLKTLLRSMEAEDSRTDEQLRDASSQSLESIFNSLGAAPARSREQRNEKASSFKSPDDKPVPSDAKQRTGATHSSVSSILQNATTGFDSAPGSPATEERSIFDAFPVPEPPPPKSPNAFEDEAYRDYIMIMEDLLASDKFGRKHTSKPLEEGLLKEVEAWLRLDEKATEYDLPMMDSALSEGLPPLGKDQRIEFKNQLETQRNTFLESRKWNEKQYTTAKHALIGVGNQCARLARSLPLDVSWEKIKEAGMMLDNTSLDTYLHACTTYTGGRRRSRGLLGGVTDSPIFDILGRTDERDDDAAEVDNNVADLPEEVATFHDLLYEPTERSLSIRVSALVAKGDGKGAGELLNSFPVSAIGTHVAANFHPQDCH